MNVVGIVQARMASMRLPGKVMLPILGTPMIGLLLKRLEISSRLNKVIVATSDNPNNRTLIDYVGSLGYNVYKGSEDDVLLRFYLAAKQTKADVVVRITADCPLIDPAIVDNVILEFLKREVDYASNVCPPTFPDGLDVEVFSFKTLERAHEEGHAPEHREHVTPYIRQSKSFSKWNYSYHEDHSGKRWTVDEPEDYKVIKHVFEHFSPRHEFTWLEVLSLHQTTPNLFSSNWHLKRDEGATMNTGQKLWKRAKRVIPGGSMLLSKRAEMFLPEQWPSYFSEAKGCTVWDLDGTPYIDTSLMGVGTNVLGYGHPEVDQAVQTTISKGNMSTLNCPEEVYLAEQLIEIHPWAQMVRFARSGGEANAIAIRIARAASGKDKVALCGYHGWHDWYLAANLSGEELSDHLLPGLEPNGVPNVLRETVLPFRYNCFEELEELIRLHPDIGVIKMEVSRSEEPTDKFLHRVRELATKNNLVLIFDECSSGFRQTYGGLHKIYDVEPDIAVFGKTLGNGYAITAIIGKREVMEAAQSSFISSTFWTERIGPTAGLKSLEVMSKIKSWELIWQTGKDIKNRWQHLSDKYGLEIEQWGLPGLQGFSLKMSNAVAAKTLITQEMLKQGYLANTTFYVSTAHTPDVLDQYFRELEAVFYLLQECNEGRDIFSLLNGPVCHIGFQRLN